MLVIENEEAHSKMIKAIVVQRDKSCYVTEYIVTVLKGINVLGENHNLKETLSICIFVYKLFKDITKAMLLLNPQICEYKFMKV